MQQIIFNADRTVLEKMIRDRSRTTQVSLSSQVWPPSLRRTCCVRCGKTLRLLEDGQLLLYEAGVEVRGQPGSPQLQLVRHLMSSQLGWARVRDDSGSAR